MTERVMLTPLRPADRVRVLVALARKWTVISEVREGTEVTVIRSGSA